MHDGQRQVPSRRWMQFSRTSPQTTQRCNCFAMFHHQCSRHESNVRPYSSEVHARVLLSYVNVYIPFFIDHGTTVQLTRPELNLRPSGYQPRCSNR
jgi:hypothetical protein